MFMSISKGVNQLHRVALNQALHQQNTKWALLKDNPQIIILVSTKNIILNIFMAMLSRNTIVLYFTGLGRLYTDFGILGRLAFMLMVKFSGLRGNRHFIIENKHDCRVLSRWTRRPITQINGSGLNKSLYKVSRASASSPAGHVIGHMSRFGFSKCTDEVIKLIENLPPEYSIIIAGKDIKGNYYSNLFYQLAKSNPQVHMLGHLETPEDVSAFFEKIDVFLYPSMREGLPITLLESVYHRVPFLTTNVAGCIDIAGRFGFPVCAPEDFGGQGHHLDVENWGIYSSRWDDILADYATPHVQSQFEHIFTEIIETHHQPK
jgi:glycosyltransferase involved in cell wall biosynthesis